MFLSRELTNHYNIINDKHKPAVNTGNNYKPTHVYYIYMLEIIKYVVKYTYFIKVRFESLKHSYNVIVLQFKTIFLD
jgi:hypothetical protein